MTHGRFTATATRPDGWSYPESPASAPANCELNIAIVNDPGLLGLAIYSQALLVPYPHQEKLSNVVSDVLQ